MSESEMLQRMKLHEDWLKLDLSLTFVGDMIGHYMCLWNIEFAKEPQNKKLMKSVNGKVRELEKERQQLYAEGAKSEIIIKAYTVYSPFLRREFLKRSEG
jgi:hypothetical protein